MLEGAPRPTAPLERELSLADLTAFVARNRWLMSLCFAGVATAILVAVVLQPKRYQRELAISVHAPFLVADQTTPREDLGEAAVKSLETLRPDGNPAQVRYDRGDREIGIVLRARSAADLGGPETQRSLRAVLDSTLRRALEARLTATALQARKWAEIRRMLEEDIARVPPADRTGREALEREWAHAAAISAGLEFDRARIREIALDAQRFSSTTFVIERDSGAQPARTVGPARTVIVAVEIGSIGAVIAALLRDWARRRLSRLKAARARDFGA